MYVWLSKILPVLMMPLSVTLLLGLGALALLISGRLRAAVFVLILALGILWLAATPLVASSLYGGLEARFPPEPMAELPASRCIVVLGGAVGPPSGPRIDIDLSEAADRVYQASRLYRAGKGERVFVAAGNLPWSIAPISEAALIGELLVEWGVPADAIQLEGRSRNTRENAVNVKPLLESAGCDRSLLVTSAAHMPRALATFRAVGLHVYPVSVDVQVAHTSKHTVMDLLPDAGALSMTSAALREWLGQLVYRLRGWT